LANRNIYAVSLLVIGSLVMVKIFKMESMLAKYSSDGKMSKKYKVNWSDIDTNHKIISKSKRCHLEKDETNSLCHFPIQESDLDGFQSQRGCRKHVTIKHS